MTRTHSVHCVGGWSITLLCLQVCNWGVLENGVYWEECYCSQDSCNTASPLHSTAAVSALLLAAAVYLL